jgi:hypothetical protein
VYLNELIKIDKNIARSVNLERDASNIDQIRRFQLTQMASKVLDRFIGALEGNSERAWSLTGPFGTGKSSFCNFLFALCSGPKSLLRKAAFENFEQADPLLFRRFANARKDMGKRGLFHLRAVSRYESLNETLLRSLEEAFEKNKTDAAAEIRRRIVSLKKESVVKTADVMTLLEKSTKITRKKLLIVVDEFGKNLEFMAHNPSSGDIFVLQSLAESNFSYLWVCLHQTFGDYASGLSQIQRNEWQKIQGRFDDISYLEPPSHVVNLILKAMRKNPDFAEQIEGKLDKWAEVQADLMKNIKIKGISDLDRKTIKQLYPFSPLSAVVLGELSHRFAQNDRTIFSFLSSETRQALSGYLSKYNIDGESPVPFLGLDWLYDYFCEITSQVHGDRSTTQRWIEIQSLIGGYEKNKGLDLKLLKTIGVLNLLSNVPGIKASLEIIKTAMGAGYNEKEKSIRNALIHLVDRRIVLYRDYADEYRLWEGSDFDIEKAIQDERARLSLGTLENMLQIAAPQPSVIASRHSFQTGALREFKQNWTTMDLFKERQDDELAPCLQSDGQIWLVLGKDKTPDDLGARTKNKPLILAYAPCEEQVIDLALQAAAAKKVFQTHTQLAQDGVARREARFRSEAAANQLQQYLTDLVTPSNRKVQWFACGKAMLIDKQRGLSSLVSKVCDETYNMCPHVHMEMINHNRLTSAAARAQRELMEAMVTSESQKDLGIKGFGPEKAIYLAMLESTGLHTFNSVAKIWQLVGPDPGNDGHKNLAFVWKTLDSLLEESETQNKGVLLTELIDTLQLPPFGLKRGPIPIFICHYIIVNDDRVALYQDGVFQPLFGAAEAALMLKRPDLFQLRRYSFKGVRRDVIQAYMAAIDTGLLEFEEKARNRSLLKIIGPLIEFMEALPDYSRHTRRISLNAQRLRGVVLTSREPLSLLFKDIPEALGIHSFSPEDKNQPEKNDLHLKLHQALKELFDVFGNLNREVETAIQGAFDFKEKLDFGQFRKVLQDRVRPLEKPCVDNQLKTIIRAMLNDQDDNARWARGIAGVIKRKPLDVWRDNDIESWHVEMAEIADRILAFEALVARTTGIEDEKGIVLSLTRVNGTTRRCIINVSSKEKERFFKKYPGLRHLSQKEKENLCAILLEETGESNGSA